MSVRNQINRLGAAKAALVSSITAKGVEVPEGVKLDELPPYVDAIEGGGGADGLPAKDKLDNMSWADIQTVCKAGKASEYWSVGDAKMVELEGAIYPVVIIGFDHDIPADIVTYGRAKAGATFQFHTLLDTSYALDNNTNGYGWSYTVFCRNYVPVFMSAACIDQEAAAVIVPVLKTTAASQAGTLDTVENPMFLLSEIEVFGHSNTSFAGEGTQYAFYAAGNSRIKKKLNGTAYSWGLRSIKRNNGGYQCSVSTSGTATANYKNTATGTALAFCV